MEWSTRKAITRDKRKTMNKNLVKEIKTEGNIMQH